MNTENRRQKRTSIGYWIGIGLAGLLLLGVLSTSASANGPLGGPYYGNGVVVGGVYPYQASTPGESFARGMADVIRARGEFNLLTSEAAINWQEARARAIVNAQDYTDAYFKMRKANRDYRRAERGPRPTQEEIERFASAGKPLPLSPSELDELTGRVKWPILLSANHFSSLRAEMEDLLDQWAVSRSLGQPDRFGAEQHLAVRSLSDRMEEILQQDVRNLPTQDYAAAKRFLRSLEYQVIQPQTLGVSVAFQ